MLRTIFTFSVILAAFTAVGQTGCPDCMTTLPAELPMDTIFLSAAPDGEAGIAYAEDLSFRMPMTTTPVNAVDPMTPAGLDIDAMTVLGVAGLPPGLSWEPSQTEFNVQEETDGCVRLCGTPLFPGLYMVDVVVEAQIFIFSQQAAFSFPLYIAPAQSMTEGFTIVNNSGCGEVTAEFINNIPSNGEEGFSYYWEFGNGNSTVAEFPQPQVYTEPGTYSVDYEVIVDTAGFYLTEVVIEEASCDDIFNGAPDLKFVLFNPEGEDIYTAPIVDNASYPVVWSGLQLPILEGGYELHVVDNDGGLDGADDLCGVINFSQELSGTLSAGDLTVSINLFNQIDTIRSTDEIIVYPVPDAPVINLTSELPYCEGDVVSLVVDNYASSLEWYRDSALVADTQEGELMVAQDGNYWVTYTSEDGCQSTSELITVSFAEPPEDITLTQSGNLLRLEDESDLPANFSVEWTFDGEIIPSADDILLCAEASGEYGLSIMDENTGCSTSAVIEVVYDPAVSCTTSTVELGDRRDWTLYPNPVRSTLTVFKASAGTPSAELFLYNNLGQLVQQWRLAGTAQDLSLQYLVPQTYFYVIREEGVMTQRGRIVKVAD